MTTSAIAERHWELFADWCAATDHQALPAADDVILEFLTDMTGGPATIRRRLQAIDTAHLAAGYPPPSTHLERAGPPPPPRFPADLVATALATIPIGGWPIGMAGRRNTALLAVIGAGGLTRRQALTLTTRSAPGQLVSVAEEPRACPACALYRWQDTLRRVDRDGWRHVRAELAEQGEITAADLEDHRHPEAPRIPDRPVMLFCPIDRHGVPETRRHLTARAVTAIVAEALHRARQLPQSAGEEGEPAGPWTDTDRARVATQRRQASERLAAMESTLADAENYADAILDRVAGTLNGLSRASQGVIRLTAEAAHSDRRPRPGDSCRRSRQRPQRHIKCASGTASRMRVSLATIARQVRSARPPP